MKFISSLFLAFTIATGFVLADPPICGRCHDCKVPLDNAHLLPIDEGLSAGAVTRHFTENAQFLDVELIQTTNTSTAVFFALNDQAKGCRTIALSTRRGAKEPEDNNVFLVWDNGETGWTSRCIYDIKDVPASSYTSVFLWRYCPKDWKWPSQKRSLPVKKWT